MKLYIPFIIILLIFVSCKTTDDILLENIDSSAIKIALIDTGISLDIIESENVLTGYNYITNSTDTNDTIGHGTSVAGILLGANIIDNEPLIDNIDIVPLVIQSQVNGEIVTAHEEVIAQSIYDAIDKYGCRVINMSLGTEENSALLLDAVNYALLKDVIIISSVGNSGNIYPEAVYYPAAYNGVIGVGSVNLNNEVSSFSQVNETVTLMGYGEGYYLALHNGSKQYASGTSFATAYVSAAAAKHLEISPELNFDELLNLMKENALDIEEEGYDIKSGYGICRQP